MTCEFSKAKQAARRYRRDIAVAGALYVALVFGAALAIRNFDPPQWVVIVLALLPVAPALLMLRAYLVFMRSMDEFQRRLQTEALIVATAITVFGSFAYGFLEEWADFPHVPLIWVFPVFAFVFGIAHVFIRHALQMRNRLKVLRAERNWSQADLADRLDVSRQSVNAIETGKYDPSLPLAFKIARVFGLSIEQIFSDEEAAAAAE